MKGLCMDPSPDIPSHQAAKLLSDPNYIWVDIREKEEWNFGHLPNMIHLPLSMLTNADFDQFSKDKQIVLVCRTGNRSGMATQTLRGMGCLNVWNLEYGLVALNTELKEKVPILMH